MTPFVQPYAFRLFRLTFFGLLAVDTFIWSYKWGSDSNVSAFRISKLPFIFEDGLDFVPTLKLVSRLYALTAAAACVASLGTDRWYTPAALVAACTYTLAYFSNACDRYQHHFLLCLLLILLPWARTRVWVQRLIFYQVAIVYFWTAVAKITDGGLFLSGAFVRTTARRREVCDAVHVAASYAGVQDTTMWSVLAVCVVVLELALCILLVANKLRWLAILIGVSMHLGIEFVGRLSIGFFSWYMLFFYVLLLPGVRIKQE